MKKPILFTSAARPLLMLSLLTLVLAGCKKDEEDVIPETCDDVEWTYMGAHGPEHWSELCLDNMSCSGQRQSPINLAGATNDPSLGFVLGSYNNTTTAIENKGHTVQFDVAPGSYIVVSSDTFQLLQFHVHAASEHTVNGAHQPMELHFVHRHAASGKLAVIGVFVREGAANSLLGNLIQHIPTAVGGKYTAADTYSPVNLLPGATAYYTYAGSLTTPPCSETVTWIVFEGPISASAAQLAAIEALIEENNRPIQALNGRVLKRFPG